MKKIFFTTLLLFIVSLVSGQEKRPFSFNDYFTSGRLRIDLIFAGNATKQNIFLKGLHHEQIWSGTQDNMIDQFHYGDYCMKVISKDGREIYSTGFNNLFQEWRTTAEAKQVSMAFASSYWIPYPKDSVKVIFYERIKSDGKFVELYKFDIDPKDKSINADKENDFEVVQVLNNGESSKKVDVLFVAEGYTKDEMDKFIKDVNKFTGYLFNVEPYKSRMNDFNIWALKSISEESGTDIPQNDIWKNTVISSNFFTFKIDRYLTAPDQSEIAKVASNAPFDIIYVIVNTNKYGGGGIYNYYALSMSDHPTEPMVFVHEFGHAFAGLADEYYNSSVAYEEFYNLKVEPWEPNITTKVNFDAKWKDMVGKNGVGLFEGGGYMAKGIFRPANDCRMKSNTAPGFCPVCVKAINDMIDYYTK